VIEAEFTIEKTMLEREELVILRRISSPLVDKLSIELSQIIHNEIFATGSTRPE